MLETKLLKKYLRVKDAFPSSQFNISYDIDIKRARNRLPVVKQQREDTVKSNDIHLINLSNNEEGSIAVDGSHQGVHTKDGHKTKKIGKLVVDGVDTARTDTGKQCGSIVAVPRVEVSKTWFEIL